MFLGQSFFVDIANRPITLFGISMLTGTNYLPYKINLADNFIKPTDKF